VSASGLLRVQILRIEASLLRGRAALALAVAAAPAQRAELLADVRRLARELDREKGWAVPIAQMLRGVAARIDGDRARAGTELEAAERGFSASAMHVFAEVMRVRRGELEGGATGAARAASAREAMRERGVGDVEAVARLLCPWPA
jgi:hypothetical protein